MRRPFLHPGLLPVRRDASTVQFGVSADRAVVIGGLDPKIVGLIDEFDGFHSTEGLHEVARAHGIDSPVLERTVALLRDHGVVVDAEESGLSGRDPTATLIEIDGIRAPDRISAALIRGGTDTGRSVMNGRTAAHVEVIGGGRVGASIARLLAHSGIGWVTCHDTAATERGDVVPGGLESGAVGEQRDHAVSAAVAAARVLPVADRTPSGGPRLVVIAPDTGTGRGEAADLLRAGTTHLVVGIQETTGVVGPLVVPGVTSCVRCHDLHRTDRDAGWPTVLHRADLARARIPARDATLVAAVAGLAAAQVLGHLDGQDVATLDGTIETTLPEALPRRRTWRPHPACGCTWSQSHDAPDIAS